MIAESPKTSVSLLKTLANMHIYHIPNHYHTERLSLIRNELKKRRLEAKAKLAEIENAEIYIASQIINTRRKRLKERQAV